MNTLPFTPNPKQNQITDFDWQEMADNAMNEKHYTPDYMKQSSYLCTSSMDHTQTFIDINERKNFEKDNSMYKELNLSSEMS